MTPAGFLLGAALAALPVAVWLTAEQAWGPLWRWCFTWAAWHQRNYPAFSAWKYLGPALREQPWLVALALAGAVGTARAVWRQRRAPSAGGADVVLLLALPMTLLSYALQRAPMPYSLVPFFGVCAVLAARALAALAEALPRPARVVGALAAVPLALAQAWALAPAPEDTAAHQLATLARLQALTAPEDCVYDNAGSAVTRPHAHFYFYTDGLIRWRDAAMLEREVPEALLARGCPARLVDVRSDSLPAGLQRFLARHYQPLDGDLALWGQRLSPGVDDTFLAVVEGAYFVTPAAALEHGRLRVDGQEVHAPVLTLTRGPHSVRLEGGGASPVYLLWLPRTGERWSPRRDLPPRFSRLF